jgi:hypothetical protein
LFTDKISSLKKTFDSKEIEEYYWREDIKIIEWDLLPKKEGNKISSAI